MEGFFIMNSSSDTIAAIATPAGDGGIGIIRISGTEAHAIGNKVFSSVKSAPAPTERTLIYGHTIDPEDGSTIDNGFIVFMSGPHTYTGEDVVELQLHGGALVLNRALGAVFRSGARAARAGEFTKRAFLSGRIDLTGAEAVMDIITAGTDEGLASARKRLEGGLSAKAYEIKESLLGIISRLEAELEFSGDLGDLTDDMDTAAVETAVLKAVEDKVTGLLASYREGAALRDGVRVLILGRANVGKSSLLNRLLGEQRAIVTPLPGTTRDVIEEAININGIPVRLMDTAGLRDTTDFVESLGVKEARKRIAGAGVILFVLDAAAGDFTEDKVLLEGLEGKKLIFVANKIDLMDKGEEVLVRHEFASTESVAPPLVFISATKGAGIKGLRDALYEVITGRAAGAASADVGTGEFIATERQYEALSKVLEGVRRAAEGSARSLPRDLIASDLREALSAIEELTGEVTTEDILDRVFSEFCIGK